MTRIADRGPRGRIRVLQCRPIRERLLEHLTVDLHSTYLVDGAPCWTWITKHGKPSRWYATIGRGGRRGGTLKAHVVAYELWFGPVPEGLQLDHRCQNPACCNPAHLEAVTQSVNLGRGRHRSGRPPRFPWSEGIMPAGFGVPWSAEVRQP
jgi:HNH endonuclease